MTEFRPGDKVFSFKYGNGEVVKIDPKLTRRRPIKVIFDGGICHEFAIHETDTRERLFHGHDPVVTVYESTPDRKKSLYLNIIGSPGSFIVTEHDSVMDARDSARIVACVATEIEVEVKS